MANQTPDATSAYRVYNSGQKVIGTAQIDLPTLSMMTVEVKGAGIAGVIDKPIVGMFQAMNMGLNFRTITDDGVQLLQSEQKHLECWAAVQLTDAGTGKYVIKQHKIIARVDFKTLTLGKHGVAETQDRKFEGEVVYLKEEYDGQEVIEIDKYNHVYRINGEDMFADVRAAIGE